MFDLTITSVNDVLFQGKAQAAVCPGSAGELTILANHAPLSTTLLAGEILVRDDAGREERFSISGGILDVGGNAATVLL